MKYEDRKKIRDEWKDTGQAGLHVYAEWLEEQLHTVRSAMSQVDDELIVNWIAPPTDGNYRKALSQLVTQGIEEDKYFSEQESHDGHRNCGDPFTEQ